MHTNGYLQLEVEEIVKETDTAFLLRFRDGEEEWVLKHNVASPTKYELGDRNVTLLLRG